MKIVKHLILRLVITGLPLIALYFYSGIAFEANRQKEHPTDVGLGIAFVFVFILIVLSIGFSIDFVRRLMNKEYSIALTNLPFLLPFIFLILYFGCLMGGGDCFCDWVIDIGKEHLPH